MAWEIVPFLGLIFAVLTPILIDQLLIRCESAYHSQIMRLPRLYAPGLPQLIEVRLAPAFKQIWPDEQARELLDLLAGWLGQYVRQQSIALHGWSMTPSHLCFLMTPGNGLSTGRLIQALGRCLAAKLRTGSVFLGRYRSALVEPGARVLEAQIWVEQLAVRDGFAHDPVTWLWSSAGVHTGTANPSRGWVVNLTDHEDYWACGNTPFDRQAAYKAKLVQGISPSQTAQIEAAVAGQWALGSIDFFEQVGKVASRRVSPGPRGRPRKAITG